MPLASTKEDVWPESDPTKRKPPQSEFFRQSNGAYDAGMSQSDPASLPLRPMQSPVRDISFERLLNAREVAARLGVSERWVRDHTTRRSPKIKAVKLGLMVRYKREDVERFMESLSTSRDFAQPRYGG